MARVTKVKKKTDSTVNKRMQKYRQNVITVTVSKEAGKRLGVLAVHYTATKRTALERIIEQAYESLPTPEPLLDQIAEIEAAKPRSKHKKKITNNQEGNDGNN